MTLVQNNQSNKQIFEGNIENICMSPRRCNADEMLFSDLEHCYKSLTNFPHVTNVTEVLITSVLSQFKDIHLIQYKKK